MFVNGPDCDVLVSVASWTSPRCVQTFVGVWTSLFYLVRAPGVACACTGCVCMHAYVSCIAIACECEMVCMAVCTEYAGMQRF